MANKVKDLLNSSIKDGANAALFALIIGGAKITYEAIKKKVKKA